MIKFTSEVVIPIIIAITVACGVKENKNVYELFIEGVKEGTNTVIKLFPTLLAIFIAVGMIRNSGILELIEKVTSKIIQLRFIPIEILPLAILKPISGSASIGVGTDIMKAYGVDSLIGKIAATIMGSTETTLYIIAVYTSRIKVKKTRHILAAALIADIAGIITSIVIWKII